MQTTSVSTAKLSIQEPATLFAADDSRLFLAGHQAPAGLYRLVGTQQEVRLDQEDDLPATCDGRVAVYERRVPTWAERQSDQRRQSDQKSDSH